MKRPVNTVLSRGAFFREAEKACTGAVGAHALSAIVFDIDHLKEINNKFGNNVGDLVIFMVAQEALRESRIVGRLGGEEFAALLDECALPDALASAERLRTRIAGRTIRSQDGLMKVTCSFGVEEWEFGDTIDDLIRRADVALFDAKTAGRNRVVSYNPAQSNLDDCKRTGAVRLGDR